MAKSKVKRRPWLKKDIRELKSLVRKKTPARTIGRTLGRTVGAVRQKAYAEGISFNTRKRASAKKRSKR